jgi:hypothetical protein
MALSKWPEVKEKLIQVEAWCRDGLIDEQIAHNLGISIDTFYKYKKEHTEFSESLKRGKEIVDIEVENALLKKTKGYNVQLVKTFKTKHIKYDNNGRKISEDEVLETGIDEVHVPADTTAQIFWLKNRKPVEWRDKHEQEIEITGLPQIIIKRGGNNE